MKLVEDAGLWSTGTLQTPAQLTAVLEVSGAVLSWPMEAGSDSAGVQLTFTDIRRADWLWRLVGEAGHVALSEQAVDGPGPGSAIDLAHIDIDTRALAPLRTLAVGHWLRRWWPASARDGIVMLDPALLDAELALLTQAAGDFFTDDTLDSDVESLLAPHAAALTWHGASADERVAMLVRACVELADDLGLSRQPAPEAAGQADYALAAGPRHRRPGAGVVAGGVASVSWAAVPPAVFDAAENTIDWSVVATGAAPFAAVTVATAAPGGAAGIPVRLVSEPVTAAGVLDDGGSAVLSLGPMTESAAWDHDWSTMTVAVGADVPESAALREQVRTIARTRLAQPAPDAYLAEIVAAQSDY